MPISPVNPSTITKKDVGKVSCTLDLQTFLPYRMYFLGAQMAKVGHDLPELLKELNVNIGEREWRVISILGAYGGLTNSNVANLLQADVATISRAVKILKSLHYVDTLNSRKDKRKLLIFLTKSGAELYDKITPKRIETGDMIDSCFSNDELSTLHHLLNKLERHLKHMENELESEWI